MKKIKKSIIELISIVNNQNQTIKNLLLKVENLEVRKQVINDSGINTARVGFVQDDDSYMSIQHSNDNEFPSERSKLDSESNDNQSTTSQVSEQSREALTQKENFKDSPLTEKYL